MSLIHNEQIMLTATYLNGLASAVLAIGGFAPLVSYAYGADGQSPGAVAAISLICLLASVALHLADRRILGRLRP